MNHNLPKIDKNLPQLSIIEGPEIASSAEVQVDLEEERKQLMKQAEAEEFWAGRNLAARNSARRAA
ncbi:MAG: hypothetical protein ABSA77_04790 [Thermoguttaceae bacterium]|jgi:hypothetical protein